MQKVKVSVGVDEGIHKAMKYKAIDEGITVQQIVEDALKLYLKPEDSADTSVETSRRTLQQTVKRLLQEGDVVVIENISVALRAIERMTRQAKTDKLA